MSTRTSQRKTEARHRRFRTTVKLTAASLAAAAALTGGLAVQMASGHDPALGAGKRAATAKAPSQPTSTPAPAPVVTSTS